MRDTERETQRERHRDRETETETQGDRKTDRQRDYRPTADRAGRLQADMDTLEYPYPCSYTPQDAASP